MTKKITDLPIEKRVYVSKVIDDLLRLMCATKGVHAYLEWEDKHKNQISFNRYLRSNIASIDVVSFDEQTRYEYAQDGAAVYLEWNEYHKDKMPLSKYMRSEFTPPDWWE